MLWLVHTADKTVLSCLDAISNATNSLFTPPSRRDKTVLSCLQLCSHRRRGQDKTVLSRPRRRCEQAIKLVNVYPLVSILSLQHISVFLKCVDYEYQLLVYMMMSTLWVNFSGGGGSILHLLGSIPHSAPDIHLLQSRGRRPTRHCQQGTPGGPVLLIRYSLLRQFRHQSNTV